MISILFKKKKKYLFLILLIILISHNSRFFHNIYMLTKYSSEERMELSYGYCENESFGFIKNINKKYNIKKNFLILNDNPDFTFNNSNWFFYKIGKKVSDENIILINNKNSLVFLNNNYVNIQFRNKTYKNYKIISGFNNCYYLKK